jgi:hypothetical protein
MNGVQEAAASTHRPLLIRRIIRCAALYCGCTKWWCNNVCAIVIGHIACYFPPLLCSSMYLEAVI